MATINNPFVMYGYKGAEYFCDREKETEKMMTSLHNERNITLVAPRRMGKTGLIHHVFQQLEKQYDEDCKQFPSPPGTSYFLIKSGNIMRSGC